MAIFAGSGKGYTAFRGLTMNAVLIILYGRANQYLMFFNKVDIVVANAAGWRQISVIYARFLVARNQDIMLAVAIPAGRNILPTRILKPSVRFISHRGIFMAIAAFNCRQRFGMWDFGYMRVTIDAAHPLMRGGGQRSVVGVASFVGSSFMAGQAIFIGGSLAGRENWDKYDQEK